MKSDIEQRANEISQRLKRPGFDALFSKAPAAGDSTGPDRFGFENAEYMMVDPSIITLEGDYVRTPSEVEAEPDFDSFVTAVGETGRIEQPAGVRTVGQGLDRRFVLIWGMRRWRAALRLGIKLPVIDKGSVSDDEAFAMQMRENENRADPQPVQVALGYHRWVRRGKSQNQIAREAGRDKGYVSYMRAAGEALDTLTPEERARVAASPLATVRRFQEIAKLSGVDARAKALRALIDRPARPAPAPREADVRPRAALQVDAADTRTGRRVRLEWRERDLKKDPVAVADALAATFREEQQRLVDRLTAMAEQAAAARAGQGDAQRFQEAADRARALLRQFQEPGV